MCSATLGADPVNRCTWAASAIFSYGLRGTPFWAKTLNLVPEFPNAHDGSSMLRSRSPSATRRSVVMCASIVDPVRPCSSSASGRERSWQVEHLVEGSHLLVGGDPGWIAGDREVRRHHRLPAGVDRLGLHGRDRVPECPGGFEGAEQGPVTGGVPRA